MNDEQKKILQDAANWVINDTRCKAPEQLTRKLYIGYIEHLMGAITKAIELLGWEPKVNRADGLKITYEYFKGLSEEELTKVDHKNFDEYVK